MTLFWVEKCKLLNFNQIQPSEPKKTPRDLRIVKKHQLSLFAPLNPTLKVRNFVWDCCGLELMPHTEIDISLETCPLKNLNWKSTLLSFFFRFLRQFKHPNWRFKLKVRLIFRFEYWKAVFHFLVFFFHYNGIFAFFRKKRENINSNYFS